MIAASEEPLACGRFVRLELRVEHLLEVFIKVHFNGINVSCVNQRHKTIQPGRGNDFRLGTLDFQWRNTADGNDLSITIETSVK